MDALRNALEGARDLGVAVELRLITGEKLLTGLHDWNGDEGWFSVYAPQHFQDNDTTRTVMVHQVSSWTVTDTPYHP
jgi:hypothetical protein